MLDIKFIRKNIELVKQNCKNRLVKVDIDHLIKVDNICREAIGKLEEMKAKRNASSKTKPSPEIIAEIKILNNEIKKKDDELKKLSDELRALLLMVPNLTHPEARVSDNEDDNPIISIFMSPTAFDFIPLDHVQLAEMHDLIDFDRATKISGSKFYYLKNELVIMEFALIQYALEIAMKHGFVPFSTPDLAKREVLEYLGFNPRGESTQVYNIENSDLCLIGTAEITLGGYHMNEVIDENELPKKYVAVSHCFRTEAGAYSKFSKGIFRVHQFTKIEMFQYVIPEKSEDAHQELLDIEKEIFEGLKIPFRVVDHCTADLGGPSYRTYDLEAWMPGKPNNTGGMGNWAEITSTSNCTDYQSRGLNIRCMTNDGKKIYLHMLNGTAIAVSRAIIAIIENYQKKDGSIEIPEVLRKYFPNSKNIINRR